METVRTRFAPSPTGFMHVGGVRTALFAWLLAQQNNGQFILRIEDTDKNREVDGSIDHIIESLEWLGLTWNEGPFKQSDRLDIYKKWAQKLLDEGRAYVDPYSSEEVQKFREEDTQNKKPFLYRTRRPENLETSWDGTKPLRFKSEPKGYSWNDEIMGKLSSVETVVDDFVIMKSDGYPTYNFAHIVDDYEMKVSHIIRGQEFLASMPNYLNLYEALGFEAPNFATVPHIMNENGNKKLSKRDGAKDILQYQEEGYLPEAMLNFLASLGWNDGTEQEVFTIDELVEKFSLERIQKSGARFDERRLLWLNGAHIRNLSLDDLYKKVGPYWPEEGKDFPEDYKKSVLGLLQERLKIFSELPELSRFFFVDLQVNPDLISTHKQLKKLPTEELKTLLQTSSEELNNIEDWTSENIQNSLNNLLEKTNKKPAELFSLIRIATTQSPSSPGLAETLELLGKEKSLQRIQTHINSL